MAIIIKEQYAWTFDPTLDPVDATQDALLLRDHRMGLIFFILISATITQPYCNVTFLLISFYWPGARYNSNHYEAIFSGKEDCGIVAVMEAGVVMGGRNDKQMQDMCTHIHIQHNIGTWVNINILGARVILALSLFICVTSTLSTDISFIGLLQNSKVKKE